MNDNTPSLDGAPERPQRNKSRLVKLVPMAIVLLVVIGAVIAMSQPSVGTRSQTDTSVTVVVGDGNGAQQVQFPIALQEGGDPAHEVDHVIEPLKGIDGVSTATLDWSSGVMLTVKYDPAVISDQQLAAIMMQTGYVPAPTNQE